MRHYEDPTDNRVYEIEKIKEWARQDVYAEIAQAEKERKRKAEAKKQLMTHIFAIICIFVCIWILKDILFI